MGLMMLTTMRTWDRFSFRIGFMIRMSTSSTSSFNQPTARPSDLCQILTSLEERVNTLALTLRTVLHAQSTHMHRGRSNLGKLTVPVLSILAPLRSSPFHWMGTLSRSLQKILFLFNHIKPTLLPSVSDNELMLFSLPMLAQVHSIFARSTALVETQTVLMAGA